jgi:hypothetical protein
MIGREMAMPRRNGGSKGKRHETPGVGYVPCRVEPGMFRGEYLVTFEAGGLQRPDKKVPVQLLADEQEVVIRSGTPERGKPAEGLLRVEVLGRARGLALLVLPQPGQPVGERAYVNEDLLQEGAGV